ncbi:hypothetical protein [Microbacterium phyllosphaerae]|uniref:hypothetical protein n=1 Tax=Microbacterium phyllosphaerae TaxID=124798 RepID=UPI000EA3DCC3|nr:hypothetical protein [Microbacterium phyllosphaerae]
MTADVNWLLSSIAQGSAAMIAIVGGLLVSRYVGLHAEQEAARRRVSDLESRNAAAVSLGAATRGDLEEIEIASLINDDDVYAALLGDGFQLTLDRLYYLTGGDRSAFDDDAVMERLVALDVELKNAYGHLDKHVPRELHPMSWADFRSVHAALPVENEGAWRWVYEDISHRERKAALAQLDTWERAAESSRIDIDVLRSVQMRPSDVPSQRRQLMERIERADADALATAHEARLAREALDASRQPAGFSLAIQVLTSLTVLGIVLPVVIMGLAVDELPALWRVTVIAVFFVGLGVLLRFLFVYASFLREGGRRSLPKTVFGLFWFDKKAVTRPTMTPRATRGARS